MKKHIYLFLSILLLIVSFVAAWYSDRLSNHFFALVPIVCFLLLCYIVLLVMSIIRIIKRKEYSNFISLAVLALTVVLVVFFPFRDAKVKYELNRLEPDRLEIVEMIKNGELLPKDELGNVILPVGYERLSSDGQVFVYQNDENGQVICFWIFRGMLSGSVELIYSSGGEELIWANESGHPITKIEKLKENWFYVQTDY